MAGAAERFIVDVDIRFDKSEQNLRQFAANAQKAVAEANASAAQAAGRPLPAEPTTPAAIGKQVAQTGAAMRVSAVSQGIPEAQLNQALQANIAEGKRRVEEISRERGLSPSRTRAAIKTYERNTVLKSQASQRALTNALRDAEMNRKSADAATMSATVETDTLRTKTVRKGAEEKRSALAAGMVKDAEVSAAAHKKLAVSDQKLAAVSTARAQEMIARRTANAAALLSPAVIGAQAKELQAASIANLASRRLRDQGLAASPAYQTALGLGRAENRMARSGLDPRTGAIPPAVIAARARAEAQLTTANDSLRAAVVRLQAASERGVAASAEKTAAERLYAGTVNRQMRMGILDGSIGMPGATRFQRLTAGMGYSGGMQGGGGLGITGGQFLGGGLLTTAKFAIPSMALFGAGRGLMGAIKEAQELDKIFAQLDSQYEATFGAEGQSKADSFKLKILEIARETGIAGQEVADVGRQFTGAFQDQAIPDSSGRVMRGEELIAEQLRASAEAAVVMGIEENKVSNEGVAVSTAFNESIRSTMNLIGQLKNLVGANEVELLEYIGAIAPAAKDAGFELEEMLTIGAVTLRESGRSGKVLAENYGRVLPAISESTSELLELASTNERLNQQDFLGAIANKDTATIFRTLMTNFEDLNTEAQSFVITLLGGRREAAALLPAFSNSEKISEIIGQLDKDTQTLAERNEKVQETFSQTMKRVGEEFRQLGTDIYEGGLGDALKIVGDGLSSLLGALRAVATIFVEINDVTGGWGVKLLTLTGIVMGLSKALRAMAASQMLTNMTMGIRGINTKAPVGMMGPAATNAAGMPFVMAPAGPSRGIQQPMGPAPGRFTRLRQLGGPVTGMGAGIIAAVGISQIAGAWNEESAKLEQEADNLRELMKEASIEQLEDIEERRFGVLARLGGFVLNQDLPDALASQEIGRRRGEEVAGERSIIDQERFVEQMGRRITEEQVEALNRAFAINEGASAAEFDAGMVPNLFDIEDFADEQFYKDLSERAAAGDEDAIFLLESLIELAAENRMQWVQKALDRITTEEKDEAKFTALTSKMEGEGNNLETLKSQFDAGTIGLDQLLEAYDAFIDTTAAALELATDGSSELQKKLADLQKERGKLYSDAMMSQMQLTAEIEGLVMGDDPASGQNQLDRMLALLQDPQFTDTDARAKVAKDVASAYRDILGAMISDAETAAEAAEIAQRGIDIDPIARRELIMAQLNENNLQFQAVLQQYNAGGEDGESLIRGIFAAIAMADEALIEFYRTYIINQVNALNDEIAKLQERYSRAPRGPAGDSFLQKSLSDLTKQRDALFGLLFLDSENVDVIDPGSNINDPKVAAEKAKQAAEEAKRKAEEEERERKRAQEEAERARKELIDAQFGLMRAVAADDPVALANIAMAQANQQMRDAKTEADQVNAAAAQINAQRQMRDALFAIQDAQFGLMSAAAGDNPVAQANIALAQANAQMARAQNEADRLNALAARIQADRQMRDAMKEIFDSEINLAKALAESVGDMVKSATLDYFAAVAELNRLIAEDPGNTAAINNAKADVVRAERAMADSKIQKQLDDYAFLYDMEQITKEQYIKYLQALRATLDPETQQDQFRAISRTIKQLQNDLSGDLQFNLPTTIDLPTLYEVRRVNQGTSGTGAAAVGYQDNRNINVTMYVTNGMTEQQAQDFLAGAMGTNRTGFTHRRY